MSQRREEESRKQNMVYRVDFIVSPPEQYPFALVSWTGSKVTTVKLQTNT